MINLMNYYEHPGDNRYYVFEYRDVQKSITFEELLADAEVGYEKFVEHEGEIWTCKYGIAKTDFKKALRANNLTESQYRKPMIEVPALRYLLVIVMGLIVALAFIGYMKSK